MIQKRDILKMAQAVYRASSGRGNRRLIHPAREWGIGLMLMLAVFLAGVVYAVYTYNNYNTIENRLSGPEIQTVRYQATQVERALEIYAARQQQLEGLSAFVPVIEIPVATSTATTTQLDTATTSAETEEEVSELQPEPSGQTELTSS